MKSPFRHIFNIRRHFWRHLKMSEMAHIYISMMIHNLSLSMTGLFGPIYIWMLTGSLADVCFMMIWYFVLRVLGLDFLSGWVMSRIGPKKTMCIGFAITALCQAMFFSMEAVGWPLWLLGSMLGMVHSFTVVPLHGEFSKIHNLRKEGKQISYLSVVEKVGSVLGPLLGGAVAAMFGGRYVFAVGLAIMLTAMIPLLMSPETVPAKRRLNLKALDFRRCRRGIFSFAASGVELTMSSPLWPLFVAVTILTPAAVYAWVGALQAVSVAAAIGITLLIGHFVDKQFGRLMLRAGALLMALFNVLRMFITQFAGALALNVSYELASAANHIPISKGFYDEADDDDTRLAYVAVVAYFDSLLKFLAWLAVFLLAVYAGDNAAFYGGFAIAGAAALFTMKERYKALDKRSFDRWNAFSRG